MRLKAGRALGPGPGLALGLGLAFNDSRQSTHDDFLGKDEDDLECWSMYRIVSTDFRDDTLVTATVIVERIDLT